VSGTFGVQSSTYVFDPATNSWKRLADLPQALGGVTLATANGKLYAFGGFDQRGYNQGNVATTYEYNPAKNTWRARATMPTLARSLAGAASLNGKIYVVGGITNGDPYTSTVGATTIYDPIANTWEWGTPVSPARSLALTVAPDNAIYAFGGEGGEGPLNDRYDPVLNKWDHLSTYYTDDIRSGVGVAYSRGRLFIVGGYDSFFNLTTQDVESLRLFDDLCLSSLAVDRSIAQPGDRLRYTIELHSGIEVLDAVSAIDPLPYGVQFAGFFSKPIGAHYDPVLNRVEWLGTMNNYSPPITITFDVTVTPELKPGQRLTNTLAVDSGAGWNMARSAVTAIDYFDLSSSVKLIDRSTLAANGIATYTIRLENPSALSGTIVVNDPLPSGATYLTGSLKASSGVASFANNAITWQGQLPAVLTYTNISGDYEWGDSRGGGTVPGVQYAWIEIADIGRPFAWYYPTHAACNPVPIPFPFDFYSTVYTTMAVQIDGTMFFHWLPDEFNRDEMGPNNQPIPSSPPISIRGYIAPFWDDLFQWPGRMWYKVVGTAPHRRLVIEYSRTSRFGPNNELGTPGEFEAILDESTSIITLQYKDTDFGHAEVNFGASATVGIQDTPEHGLQYSYNTPSLSNELAIVYVPPQQTYTTPAHSAEVRFAASLASDQLPIINTATITDSFGTILQRWAAAFIPKAWVYLPMILR
ncbi:MAG TPA: kelch repeat-containing protein, partial [Anaerolineae bacterium]|nr:kelch repeat-containing protein [Anaerolineae bacterium]